MLLAAADPTGDATLLWRAAPTLGLGPNAATGEKVRKREVDTLGVLTPQEEHIARLARDGRTNPEIGAELFLSGRTVEWHLRKIFIKLGITSRKGLHDALPPRQRHAPSESHLQDN
jgi:DNA-binding NarL/FixJ family response regulator